MEGINEFRQLEPNTLVTELVAYIELELPNFPTSLEFIDVLEQKKNENQHSLSFCLYMTNGCKSKFYFARENAQKGSSVIDIGVYRGSILIFTIEAKLLPVPLKNDSGRNEHEYVFGKGAAIQRFKDGKHGLDNNDSLLDENGVIAFVKESDFDFWLTKVNQWVIEASWKESEKLKKAYFTSIGKLTSIHQRYDNSNVTLHHFWVDVNSLKQAQHIKTFGLKSYHQ
ncbi:MAG TPA: hypothetical protein VGB63_16865 [Pedobacter sp.]|jgi:hypothetical protein